MPTAGPPAVKAASIQALVGASSPAGPHLFPVLGSTSRGEPFLAAPSGWHRRNVTLWRPGDVLSPDPQRVTRHDSQAWAGGVDTCCHSTRRAMPKHHRALGNSRPQFPCAPLVGRRYRNCAGLRVPTASSVGRKRAADCKDVPYAFFHRRARRFSRTPPSGRRTAARSPRRSGSRCFDPWRHHWFGESNVSQRPPTVFRTRSAQSTLPADRASCGATHRPCSEQLGRQPAGASTG